MVFRDFIAMSKITWPHTQERVIAYWRLARFDRPIGILLLLWPALWGLWLAAEGFPSGKLIFIFVLGVVLMRAAGCVINDFADRKVDADVERTKGRPIVSGLVQPKEALWLFTALCLAAFVVVLFTNEFTIKLSLGGVALAFCYPFMKRYTHLPQVVLGAAFAWAVPMAFAAQTNALPANAWLVYTVVVMWTVVYDTFYAMVDRNDDIKIGVKSTAILFGEMDRVITGFLQALVVVGLLMMGGNFDLSWPYYVSVAATVGLFIYQQWLIKERLRDACFKAFLNNNWVGCAVFIGIYFHYALS